MPNSIVPFLNVRAAYWPTVSADSRHLAFLSNITGRSEAWRVALDGDAQAWPDQMTFEGDRVMGAWYSPVNAEQLLYSADAGGSENAQIKLLDGAESRSLTAGHEDAMHMAPTWLPDGSGILFVANRRHGGLFDLYRQPLDGEAELIYAQHAPGYLYYLTPSTDGDTVVAVRMMSSQAADLLAIDVRDGSAESLNFTSEAARYRCPAFSADGRSLYVLTDANADSVYVARLDLLTKEVTTLYAPPWEVEMLVLSPDKRQLALVVNEDGVGAVLLYDTATHTVTRCPAIDGAPGVAAAADGQLLFSADCDTLYFSYNSAVRTYDIFAWHLPTNTVTALTHTSHGGLDTSTFVVPRLISYPTFDGRDIPAWYYAGAASDQPKPTIVRVHGGPEGQYRPNFDFLVQYFVQNGFNVLAPNVRGSSGYGKAYGNLDNVRLRMDSVADLAHAARWLHDQPDIDNERIVVYGGSYGGFMVLSAMTTYPDLWAAGVDIVGIASFVTFLENTSDYRRAHREAEYGSLAEDRDFLDSISPINHIDNLQAPLMIIHGRNDPRVPVSEAEQLAAALEARGVPVNLLIFDDEGHGVAKLKNKLVMYPAVVAFLKDVS